MTALCFKKQAQVEYQIFVFFSETNDEDEGEGEDAILSGVPDSS